MTLIEQLPATADPDPVFEAFADWAADQGLALYPHQEEALIEIVSGANVILSTPTGSGKSLVATGAHFAALARDELTFYTAPIKALVSEKFFALCDIFGPENVGMMTGDGSVNAGAPIICCTAEVLANIALRDGADADVGQVVMDEFHYYADPERGWAWQVPLIELPQAQFLLMSATLGDVSRFEEDLTRRTGRPTAVVKSVERPVPLVFSYAMTPLHETVTELLTTHQAPVYIVHFTQAAAIEQAQALMSINVSTPGREGRDRRADRQLPVRVRASAEDAVPAGPARHRRAPRGHAAQVPPAGRDAGPGRAAQGHLRHRHPGRRHQRADPHRAVHRAVQVRRHPDPAAHRAGVPPDRRAGRAGRVRHHGPGGRAGARARDRERAGAGQGGRRPARSGARWSARSRPRASVGYGLPTFERLVAGRAGAAALQLRASATRCC